MEHKLICFWCVSKLDGEHEKFCVQNNQLLTIFLVEIKDRSRDKNMLWQITCPLTHLRWLHNLLNPRQCYLGPNNPILHILRITQYHQPKRHTNIPTSNNANKNNRHNNPTTKSILNPTKNHFITQEIYPKFKGCTHTNHHKNIPSNTKPSTFTMSPWHPQTKDSLHGLHDT